MPAQMPAQSSHSPTPWNRHAPAEDSTANTAPAGNAVALDVVIGIFTGAIQPFSGAGTPGAGESAAARAERYETLAWHHPIPAA